MDAPSLEYSIGPHRVSQAAASYPTLWLLHRWKSAAGVARGGVALCLPLRAPWPPRCDRERLSVRCLVRLSLHGSASSGRRP